ncbi:MAG: Lrp/AsnC family transcriptional regulator [Sphingomicrobium sp.]
MTKENMPYALDPLDRRILRVLQQRADTSQADLAAEVCASPASCWRRIKALEAAGVLGPAVRLVDPVKIGRGLDALCQVRMKNHSPDARAAFDAFVLDHPEVMDCYSTSGEWDYLLHVAVASVADYERFLMQELLNHPAVATSASHFALKRVKYSTALPV